MATLPAILYQKDVILLAPKGKQRSLCMIIPLIQRLSITGNVSSYLDSASPMFF